MTRTQLYNRTLRILGTNSSSYKQTNFNDDLIESIQLRTMQILRLGGYKHITHRQSYTPFLAVTGLVEGNNGYNGEYRLPTDLLDIERIELTYDGENWHTLTKENGGIYDTRENYASEQNSNSIQDNFSKESPKATIIGGSIFIRPLNEDTTQADGLHIFYSQRQIEIDENSDIPEFEYNLHQLLMYDCALLEMQSKPETYDQLVERRIRQTREELDKEFSSFYRERIRTTERLTILTNNYN